MMQKETIIGSLTDHASAKCSEITGLIGVKNARARQILTELAAEGTVVVEGANRKRTYRLKS